MRTPVGAIWQEGAVSGHGDCSRWHSNSLAEPAEHSRAEFPLQVWSHLVPPLEQMDGHRHGHRDELKEVDHVQWGLWTLRASEPTHTSTSKEMWAINSENLAFSDSLLSMASNSRMLQFLPGFNDLSPLNYAPWVTVMFSDGDRWMESHLSLFGVLTESELIFCLAWLILAGSSYYFTYSLFSLSVTTEIIWIWATLEAGLTSNQISSSLTAVQSQHYQSPLSPGKASHAIGWIKQGEHILWVTADSCMQTHLTLTC